MRMFHDEGKFDRILQGEKPDGEPGSLLRKTREQLFWKNDEPDTHKVVQYNFLEQLFWDQELGKVIDIPHRH